ncbi:YrhK family protein [Nocardioides mesophilus]|uniref:YrhK family protein n=2 Tax=Nocardioides mesophilus TaxID=433659 RepID=A0A7G9RHW2_9ACTN|nr:YrhK family protein [Nocardioides mesophilus]
MLFVVGSVMFFWEGVKTAAIWLFVLGSLGMLIGSLGELLVRVEKHRRDDH